MAQFNPSTPERELLKLIEEDSKTSFSSGSNKIKRILSFTAVKGRLSFLKRNILRKFSFKEFSIASFNRLLAIILLALVFYVSIDILTSANMLKKRVDNSFKMEGNASFSASKEISHLRELAYYVNEAKKRDIFNIITVKKEEKLVEKQIDDTEIIEKTKHLKLVGIAWSDNPDAMIEDANAKRTIFVKEGDNINEIVVKKILKDKVILSLEGKEIELK